MAVIRSYVLQVTVDFFFLQYQGLLVLTFVRTYWFKNDEFWIVQYSTVGRNWDWITPSLCRSYSSRRLGKGAPYLHSVTGRLVLLNLSQRLPFYILRCTWCQLKVSAWSLHIPKDITCSGCMLWVSSLIQERMAIGLHWAPRLHVVESQSGCWFVLFQICTNLFIFGTSSC